MEALRFIVSSLLSLVFFAFLLRVILQMVRADFRNPISAAIMRVTNPLVLPLRRLMPPVGKIDLASIVALLLVELACVWIELWMSGFGAAPAPLLMRVLILDLARKILQFYMVALIIYAILSWVAPGTYSPASALLDRICEPVLAPFRRFIPAIGGIDLSVVFAMILLGALLRLL